MNGYFQFENLDDGLYLNIYAPTDGGRPIMMDDIIHYMDKANVGTCDIAAIKTAIVGCKDKSRVRVGEKVLTSNEWGEYRISSDALQVVAVFYPEFVGAGKLSHDEIVKDLANMGVKYGIKESVIDEYLAKRNYFEPIVVAEGTAPIEGKDAYITYNFDLEKTAKPKINDDGTVDYHNLDTLNHVTKDSIVAVLTPEVLGTDGKDVLGRTIAPKRVRRMVFKHGRNLKVSDDGCYLISEVSGHVMLEGDKVFVSNVLELVNVDASTGDINYDGNVVVTGNVVSGYAVKASGDVEVRGIVEGARIEAGGDLTLVHGVQGMGKASLICNGNMVTKFLESAVNVQVGGNLDTDTILHSNVMVRGNISALGKNGLIIGGDVRATQSINAKFVGNTMETATTIGVGVDPSDKKKLEAIKKEIIALNDSKMKINQIIAVLRKKQEVEGTLEPDKVDLLQKSTRNLILTDSEMSNKRKEMEALNQLISEDTNAKIKIQRTIYPGVKIMFGDSYIFLKNKYDYCQFVKQGADIKSIPM